jgi:hypothetical protein
MKTQVRLSKLFRKSLASPPLILAAAVMLPALTGLCAGPLYPSFVEADGALGYYRFNDSLTRDLINVNSGSLGAAGNASNDLATITLGVVHSMPGAIVGDGDRASFYDYTCRTEIPFNSAINTPNTQPFTVEAWLYPVSDQVATGMGTLCNRWTQGGNRQGWVMYQRAPDANHDLSGGPGMGWEFRMYTDVSTSTGLDVMSSVPFTLGKWQHVVVVYDPVQVTNATLTMYIDGVPAATNIWATADIGSPGYGPCTGNHDPAPNGQPAMSLGGYNNANSGTAGFANPWFGGVDEFAWYGAKLTPAQVLAHYQNATNAARSTPYATLIKSDNPVVYLRLNEVAPGPDTAFNIGDLRSVGNASNTPAIKHPGTSALAGRAAEGSHSGHNRDTSNSGHALTSIPWNTNNNPSAELPFTLEAWFRATSDQQSPGPSPICNRLAGSATDRTGWVIYQRDPNSSYSGVSGSEGVGWNFRAYVGTGTGHSDVTTSVPYNIGEWQHFVVTWEPSFANILETPSGAAEWFGTLKAYVNGVAVVTNDAAYYAANVGVPIGGDAGLTPADLAVGSYNAASNYGEEFEGDVAEVAFYNSVVLLPEQVLAHYQAGTNAHPATNYEALVFSAGGDAYLLPPIYGYPPIPSGTTIPKTYLRFNEPAYFPAANSGSVGWSGNGSLVMTTNIVAGPTGAGFEPGNAAVILDGTNKWVALNNPSGLQVSGQITLEAWIKPGASQGATARIISHGPATPTVYDLTTYPLILSGSQLSSNEVFLRIEGSGTTYAVGTTDGATTHGASAAVTAGDLGGANGWIYLAGTYDGSHWNLYRNGVPIASTADATGALPVTGGEWAIGATGMGWGDFYSGEVDEVAIYGTALSANTVKAHYYVGQNGTVSLNITNSGGVISVSWPAGTLQQADAPNGTWSDVLPTPSNPYHPPAGPTKKFYRVRL